MVVVLRDGTIHVVPDAVAQVAKAQMTQNASLVDLFGDGSAVVSRSAIAQVLSDEQYELTYGKTTAAPEPIEAPLDLSYLREGRAIAPVSPTGERWLRLMAINNAALKATGKYGTLRTLADLERYEAGGEVEGSAPAEPSGTPGTTYGWIRKLVTARQYDALYAGRPGYWVLEKTGTDVVVGFKKPSSGRQGAVMPPGEAWCDAGEVERLMAASRSGREVVPDDFYEPSVMAERREENRVKYMPAWKRELEAKQEAARGRN